MKLHDVFKGNYLQFYVTWEIHSGEKVMFLGRLVEGLPPSMQTRKVGWSTSSFKRWVGSSFWDYVLAVEIYSRRVLWKEPQAHLLSQSSLLSLRNSFAKRIVFLSNRQDIIRWTPSKGGNYSIKEGCYGPGQMDNSINTCRAFSFCWNSVVFPKAGWFCLASSQKKRLDGLLG